jgi:hypothetical protein
MSQVERAPSQNKQNAVSNVRLAKNEWPPPEAARLIAAWRVEATQLPRLLDHVERQVQVDRAWRVEATQCRYIG